MILICNPNQLKLNWYQHKRSDQYYVCLILWCWFKFCLSICSVVISLSDLRSYILYFYIRGSDVVHKNPGYMLRTSWCLLTKRTFNHKEADSLYVIRTNATQNHSRRCYLWIIRDMTELLEDRNIYIDQILSEWTT